MHLFWFAQVPKSPGQAPPEPIIITPAEPDEEEDPKPPKYEPPGPPDPLRRPPIEPPDDRPPVT